MDNIMTHKNKQKKDLMKKQKSVFSVQGIKIDQ